MLTAQIQTIRLAKQIGANFDLYFKREDMNPYGSHKGRSIPLMIEKYAKAGMRNFVISSSGNAALAAALYIKKYNQKNPAALSLTIFVGKNIDTDKLSIIIKLKDENIKIKQTTNPKQSAFQMDKTGQAKNLRQSTDDSALLGYENLAKELAEIKNLSAIFIPTSSGTTAEGLYNGFKKLVINPQIHIVQTEACHPIADSVIASPAGAKQSLELGDRHGALRLAMTHSIASAIVDKVAHRKKQVVEIIKKSAGGAWVPSDEEILEAIKLVKNTEGIAISPNSALSVAGLIHSIKTGGVYKGSVICLITGK